MSENVIEIHDLSRRFGRKTALRNLSLDVADGSVFGLVGENGAGKTTVIKHVLGLFRPQQGSVSVFGLDPVQDPIGVLGRTGYLSEDRDMPPWMRVEELMRYSRSFYPNWDEPFAVQLREMFELPKSQKIKTLSRGQRARMGLLIAVAHRPRLLLLDEPSSGLDPSVRRDILTAIIRTVADEGRTVVFSSHLLDEVERVADSVALLHEGRVIMHGAMDDVLASHTVIVLRFEQPQAEHPNLNGGISWRGEDREWTCLCNGKSDELKKAAAAAGATIVEERSPSLEEVFLARTGN